VNNFGFEVSDLK